MNQDHEEYYAYLNGLRREITANLMKSDGFVDSHKVDIFFEKIATPYVFWKEERIHTSQVSQEDKSVLIEDEERENLLSALEKKYGLVKKNGVYSIKSPLSKTMFTELNRKMKDAGFKYETGKGFVEVIQ